MNRFALAVCVALAAFIPVDARASSDDVFELTAESAEQFREQAAGLRAEMSASGKYASLKPDEKARIARQLENLQQLYDGREAGKRFRRNDELKLINASEEINGLLTGTMDDRIVCEQVRKVGSNRAEKLCLSVAERRTRSEEANKDLRNWFMGADAKVEKQGASAGAPVGGR